MSGVGRAPGSIGWTYTGLAGPLIAAALLAAPARAQDGGRVILNSATGIKPVGENTETAPVDGAGGIPFRISVDGETVDKSATPGPPDRQRRMDLELSAVDIQVKFDGLDVQPVLGVAVVPDESGYAAGDMVTFETFANYPRFVARGEIRIFDSAAGSPNRPLAVIPAALNGTSSWTLPAGDTGFGYVLRVYDHRGRFDQTAPQEIPVSGLAFDAPMFDLGTNHAAVRNIAVSGGSVTVYGRHVPDGYSATVLGENVALDSERSFVVRRILPAGDHRVDVALTGGTGAGSLQFSREINIPQDDWFYVALADVTVGIRTGDNMIETVREGEYNQVYNRGRLAFYLKGKIRGKYLFTAAADTGTDTIGNLFGNLGRRDVDRLLRQLNPEEFYPVYGDDSTMVDDAPTDGRFYVRLERGDSHVMWGNFRTHITGTEFMRSERNLYGASAVYRSPETTTRGERRTDVRIYAALPDNVPQRDEFLATGGTAYFLRRQDVAPGSEAIEIEIRDAVSGRVIERRTLHQGADYRIDYLQGVLLLNNPVPWLTGSDSALKNSSLGGQKIYVVAQYAYIPAADDLDGYALGGRAEHWINDNIRVGVTGTRETTDAANQYGVGADLELRLSDSTYLRAEIARSEGLGFSIWRSTDGGLTWAERGSTGALGMPALAWQVEGQAALADIGVTGVEGIVGGYVENKQAGFSSLVDEVNTDRWAWGAHTDLALTEDFGLAARYDDFRTGNGVVKREGEAEISWQINERLRAAFGIGFTELRSSAAIAAGKAGYNGSRVDGGVRLEYRMNPDVLVYTFGQATVRRSGDIDRNDRVGAGVELNVSDALAVTGELSYGTTGLGAFTGLTYDPNKNEHYYFGYRLDPDRANYIDQPFELVGGDNGTLVAGVRRRLDDVASAYAESSYDVFGKRRSLTHTYGITLTPDAIWTIDAGVVAGHIRDDTIDPNTRLQRSDFDRYAPSLGVRYVDEEAGIKGHVNGELRIEDSTDNTRDQNTYVVNTGLAWKTSNDWRLVASLDGVFSNATSVATTFANRHYIEASIGYAYRPVDNERLNALFRYTFLYDMPGNSQTVSAVTGDQLAPAQRSHILSADMIYDLTPWLSVGAKYGFRFGEVRNRTNNGTGTGFETSWQTSTAHLGIIRADVHVVKNWDVLAEVRMLRMPEAATTDFGAVGAVYRHFGNNFKVGVGYNFGRFSDDLRDLTLDDQGFFLNAVGKF